MERSIGSTTRGLVERVAREGRARPQGPVLEGRLDASSSPRRPCRPGSTSVQSVSAGLSCSWLASSPSVVAGVEGALLHVAGEVEVVQRRRGVLQVLSSASRRLTRVLEIRFRPEMLRVSDDAVLLHEAADLRPSRCSGSQHRRELLALAGEQVGAAGQRVVELADGAVVLGQRAGELLDLGQRAEQLVLVVGQRLGERAEVLQGLVELARPGRRSCGRSSRAAGSAGRRHRRRPCWRRPDRARC